MLTVTGRAVHQTFRRDEKVTSSVVPQSMSHRTSRFVRLGVASVSWSAFDASSTTKKKRTPKASGRRQSTSPTKSRKTFLRMTSQLPFYLFCHHFVFDLQPFTISWSPSIRFMYPIHPIHPIESPPSVCSSLQALAWLHRHQQRACPSLRIAYLESLALLLVT